MKYPKFSKPSHMSEMEWNKALLFSAVSFILLLILAGTAIYELNFFLTSNSADGEVVALNAGKRHVSIKFKTTNGKEITYPQNGFISYSVGEKVRVLYNPERPILASTDAIGALWSGTIALLQLTTIFSLVSIASFKSKK